MLTNEELPYEQQMLHILRSYDRIVEENHALKAENARQREELSEKRGYYPPSDYKHLRDLYDTKTMKLDWVVAQLTEYLKSLGVEIPKHPSIKSIVNLITSI